MGNRAIIVWTPTSVTQFLGTQDGFFTHERLLGGVFAYL